MAAAGGSGESAVAPKADPGTLVLRGRPRPAIRFRRGLIIATAAAAGSALVALAWAAFEPASFITSGDRSAQPSTAPSPDAIAGAPASYADVPQLGPPLPGDLGRAIADGHPGDGEAGAPDQPEAGSAAAARQRRSQERVEARKSPVLAELSRAVAERERPLPQARDWAGPVPPSKRAADRRVEKESVLSGNDGAGLGIPGRPRSRWTLAAGTVIPASLLTGLNSDLPGMVVAQVTQDVRDSATGDIVLIPRGARLIGDYDSHIGFGQQRALLVWKRLLFPDGSAVDLGATPATDAAGFSGLEDGVDVHERRLLEGVLLSSLLGAGSELGFGSDDRGLVRALRESAQSNGARAGDAIVSRNLDVQPTLTVRPGWPVRALLHRDLVLKPWRGR